MTGSPDPIGDALRLAVRNGESRLCMLPLGGINGQPERASLVAELKRSRVGLAAYEARAASGLLDAAKEMLSLADAANSAPASQLLKAVPLDRVIAAQKTMRAAVAAALPRFEECGCCGHRHRPEFHGDCRNDSERFTDAELDAWLAADGWTPVDLEELAQ